MNYLKITNSATTNCPSISALGDDTYIGIDLLPKAGGIVSIICGGTNRTTVFNMDNYTAKIPVIIQNYPLGNLIRI